MSDIGGHCLTLSDIARHCLTLPDIGGKCHVTSKSIYSPASSRREWKLFSSKRHYFTSSHTHSSAMDISSHIFLSCNSQGSPQMLPSEARPPSYMTRGQKAYLYSCNKREGRISPLSGTDSDLEAFSHYPADGSFAALPGRAAAKTNYLNQRFLSY